MKKFLYSLFCIILSMGTLTLCSCGCSHEYDWEKIIEASCTQKSLDKGICIKCGEEITKEGDFGHVYEIEVIEEANCVKKGLLFRYCMLCGINDTIEIAKKPHNYISNVCTVCGDFFNLSQDIKNSLITETNIKTQYSLGSIKGSEITSIWLDDFKELNLCVKFNGISSITIRHSITTVDYVSEQGESKEIFGLKVDSHGEFIVYYVDGTFFNYGNMSEIAGLLINNYREVYILFNGGLRDKIGVLKVDKPIIESDFIYEESGEGYVVTKFINHSKTQISIPSVYNGKNVVGISNYAFKELNKLESVILGDNIEYIGAWAFWKCANLTTMTFGSSVKKVYGGAFYRTGLNTIYYSGTKQQKESIVFDKNYQNLENVTWNFI